MDQESDKKQLDSGVVDVAEEQSPAGWSAMRAVLVAVLVVLVVTTTVLYMLDIQLPGFGVGKNSVVPVAVHDDTAITARLTRLEHDLQQQQETMDRMSTSVNLFWALSEVEYMLTMARHAATIEKDVVAAAEFLNYADIRLAGIQLQGLQQVRQHISTAIKDLHSTSIYSTSELMAMLDKLHAMITSATGVPASHNEQDDAGSPAISAMGTDTAEITKEESLWATIWRDITSLVKITKLPDDGMTQDAAVATAVQMQRYWYELRSAVLSRDDGSFQWVLAEIRAIVTAGTDITGNELEFELDKLANIRMRPEIDSTQLDSALESLRACISSREAFTCG